MLKFVFLLLAAVAASFVAAETAYFAFKTHGSTEDFVFQLTDDNKIAHARRILSGEEKENTHVMGRILKRKAAYNPSYDFSIDPSTVSFFLMAIEVCDATLPYVNEYLDEACGAFLPGCFYCPWSSVLTREVEFHA